MSLIAQGSSGSQGSEAFEEKMSGQDTSRKA